MSGKAVCKRVPKRRPHEAPVRMHGTKSPLGMDRPYVMEASQKYVSEKRPRVSAL